MKIQKPYDKTERIHCPTGEQEIWEWEYKYNNDGTKELVKAKKRNIYNEIQQYKDECDLVTIINRLGGIEQLGAIPAKGVYADLTQLPRNLYEAQEMREKADASFLKLPTQIREEFNNDPLQFMAAIGTDKFKKAYERYYREALENVKEPRDVRTTTNQDNREE